MRAALSGRRAHPRFNGRGAEPAVAGQDSRGEFTSKTREKNEGRAQTALRERPKKSKSTREEKKNTARDRETPQAGRGSEWLPRPALWLANQHRPRGSNNDRDAGSAAPSGAVGQNTHILKKKSGPLFVVSGAPLAISACARVRVRVRACVCVPPPDCAARARFSSHAPTVSNSSAPFQLVLFFPAAWAPPALRSDRQNGVGGRAAMFIGLGRVGEPEDNLGLGRGQREKK